MIYYYNMIFPALKKTILAIVIYVCLSIVYLNLDAQEKPPHPIKVTTFQQMSFGSIILGNSGGTVIIYPDGTRSRTGDVILPTLGSQGYQAIFEVKAEPGTLITILFGSTTLSNGGHSMNLQLGPSNPVSPFINTLQPNGKTDVNLGGTLTVGNNLQNPAGNYNGSFTVTFIQQ
jgi:hypothetical protein